MIHVEFSDLLGKTINSIDVDKSSDIIVFNIIDGSQYKMLHQQECCESVNIEDIIGDLDDLIGSPILQAEEVHNSNEHPQGFTPEYNYDSFLWTFYKLATIKGYVTIRWFGSSNGYYSESVNLYKIDENDI